MSTRRRLLIAGTGALLLVALLVGAALAQSAPTPSATPQAQSGQSQTQTKTNYAQYFLDRLAAALNISRDQLNSAAQQAGNDTIDKEVQDGRITADQANNLRQKLQQNNGFGGWFGLGPGGRGGRVEGFRGGFIGGDAYAQGVAKALGISTDELKTQLQSGKTVADLAKEKNVSADQVKSDVIAAVSASLDQAVKDGKLTADQATKIKDELNARSADQFLQMGPKGMMWGAHPRGGQQPKSKAPGTTGPSA